MSKRKCSWLYVMDDDGMMISVSGTDYLVSFGPLPSLWLLGRGLVCVHDLNSLLVGPGEEIRFKTTKIVDGILHAPVSLFRPI